MVWVEKRNINTQLMQLYTNYVFNECAFGSTVMRTQFKHVINKKVIMLLNE